MSQLLPFNPLENNDSSLNSIAVKKLIHNLLTSYNGWYDPFCEAIQNALDSIDARIKLEDGEYKPSIWVTIDLKNNCLMVTDNGTGLDEKNFEIFLQPNVTLKDKGYRGHKGVGATYLAYSFNYVQICSKTPDFKIIAKMEKAKKWVDDSNLDQFPKMSSDNDQPKDTNFNNIDKGFSLCIQCDQETFPRDLSWLQVKDAKTWLHILSIKTGLGSIKKQDNIKVCIEVIDKNGENNIYQQQGIEYLWIHQLPLIIRNARFHDIKEKKDNLYKKDKDVKDLKLYPSKLKDLDIIYDFHNYKTLIQLIENSDLTYLKDDELKKSLLDICKKYEPYIYCCYSYSEIFWEELNNSLNIRSTAKIFKSGIQLAADNMPQGEILPIDFKSVNADMTYIVIHFDNCEVDMGRKCFLKDLQDFAQDIAKILVIDYSKYRPFLKSPTGQKRNRQSSELADRWKDECKKYAEKNPLNLSIYNIPIICKPAREQDVVALFNQLLGAKVICGIEIMSTDGHFIYDCLFQHKIEPSQIYIYDEKKNPLGLFKEDIINQYERFNFPFCSNSPQVLEYKCSIDGLIEDLKDGEKNSNDLDMLVVWETGNKWKNNYYIASCLDKDNIYLRPYHGVTHIMYNRYTNEHEMNLIVLEELIDFLNNPEEEEERQKQKYEG